SIGSIAGACLSVLVECAAADDRADCIKAAGDEAIAACSRLIKSESFKSGSRGVAHPWFYNRGVAYEREGDLDAALADLSEAIRLDAKFATAYTARGTTYWQQGKAELALADWNEAIRLANAYPNAYNDSLPYMNRGALYYGLRRQYDLAIADLTEAIRLDPKNGMAYS